MIVDMDRRSEQFAGFFTEAEPRLRHALVANYGPEVGREAAADALEYSWTNWQRISAMDYPIAYLYRVGQSAAKKYRGERLVLSRSESSEPWFEPALLPALSRLTARQRTAVVMRYAFDHSFADIAQVMGVAVPTVQKHVDRAMEKLRKALEVGE